MAAQHSGDNFDQDTEENDTIPELVTKIEPKNVDDVDFDDEEDPNLRLLCIKCHKNSTTKRCANCKSVYYCSRECQKEDWKSHKRQCLDLPLFRKKKKIGTEKDSMRKIISDQLHLRSLLKEAIPDENQSNFQVVKDLLESSEDKNPFVDFEDDGITPITLLEMAANYGRMDVFMHVSGYVNQGEIKNFRELMKTVMVRKNDFCSYQMMKTHTAKEDLPPFLEFCKKSTWGELYN